MPLRVYFHVDGARIGNPYDHSSIIEIRNLVDEFSKKHQVILRFQDSNLGMKRAMIYAINWFFQNEEYGLIVEEDVLIHPDSPPLVLDILTKNIDNREIGAISLNNMLPEEFLPKDCDIYASNLVFIWGWATWKRVWTESRLDLDDVFYRMKKIEINRSIGIFAYIYFLKYFLRKARQSWDGSFMLSLWERNLKTIQFVHNLSVNLGFDHRATNTKNSKIIQPPMPVQIKGEWEIMRYQCHASKKLDILIVREIFGVKGLRIKLFYLKWFLHENIKRTLGLPNGLHV